MGGLLCYSFRFWGGFTILGVSLDFIVGSGLLVGCLILMLFFWFIGLGWCLWLFGVLLLGLTYCILVCFGLDFMLICFGFALLVYCCFVRGGYRFLVLGCLWLFGFVGLFGF